MSERNCTFCKTAGCTCERPYVPGEPKARIVVENRGTQSIVFKPIERCAKRLEILGRVKLPTL